MTSRARSGTSQKPDSAICASRALSAARLVSKSKQPPELDESLFVPAQLPGAFGFGHGIHSTGVGRSRRDDATANDTSRPQRLDGSHYKYNPLALGRQATAERGGAEDQG